MLPLLAITLAVIFFVLLRMGVLDELASGLRGGRSTMDRGPRRLKANKEDPEQAKRLEVFKDFLEGSEDPDDG